MLQLNTAYGNTSKDITSYLITLLFITKFFRRNILQEHGDIVWPQVSTQQPYSNQLTFKIGFLPKRKKYFFYILNYDEESLL